MGNGVSSVRAGPVTPQPGLQQRRTSSERAARGRRLPLGGTERRLLAASWTQLGPRNQADVVAQIFLQIFCRSREIRAAFGFGDGATVFELHEQTSVQLHVGRFVLFMGRATKLLVAVADGAADDDAELIALLRATGVKHVGKKSNPFDQQYFDIFTRTITAQLQQTEGERNGAQIKAVWERFLKAIVAEMRLAVFKQTARK